MMSNTSKIGEHGAQVLRPFTWKGRKYSAYEFISPEELQHELPSLLRAMENNGQLRLLTNSLVDDGAKEKVKELEKKLAALEKENKELKAKVEELETVEPEAKDEPVEWAIGMHVEQKSTGNTGRITLLMTEVAVVELSNGPMKVKYSDLKELDNG